MDLHVLFMEPRVVAAGDALASAEAVAVKWGYSFREIPRGVCTGSRLNPYVLSECNHFSTAFNRFLENRQVKLSLCPLQHALDQMSVPGHDR